MNTNDTDIRNAAEEQIQAIAEIADTLTGIQQTLDSINNSPAPISSTSYSDETYALRLTSYKLNNIAHNIDELTAEPINR